MRYTVVFQNTQIMNCGAVFALPRNHTMDKLNR